MFEVYSVEYTQGTTTTVDYVPYPTSNYTITNLLLETEYSVRVALNNSAGLGDYSFPPMLTTTVGPSECLTYLHKLLFALRINFYMTINMRLKVTCTSYISDKVIERARIM